MPPAGPGAPPDVSADPPRQPVGPVRFIEDTAALIIACLVKTRERFLGIGQILTMPLFFASNAIYPVALMPPALRWFAHANPLTYQTDILRALMLTGGRSAFGLPLDFAVLIGALVLLIAIAARLYPRVVQ